MTTSGAVLAQQETERDATERGPVAHGRSRRQGLRHGAAACAASSNGCGSAPRSARSRSRTSSTTTCASISRPSPRRPARAPTRTTAAMPLRRCSHSAERGSPPRSATTTMAATRRATMLEAAAFGGAAAYALKELAGRERPYVTADSGDWGGDGESFPSVHTTAAFAIGTVLAESGNDRHRWLRRVLGYGLAVGTAYARMDHDAHWLSDTVAGAGLGIATARFVIAARPRRAASATRARFPWPTASRSVTPSTCAADSPLNGARCRKRMRPRRRAPRCSRRALRRLRSP